MKKPDSIRNFDFHNHPFNKGALSRSQRTLLSWDAEEIKFDPSRNVHCLPLNIKDEYYLPEQEILEYTYDKRGLIPPNFDIDLMARQIFNSQASLTQLSKSATLSVTTLIAMEQAYAETWFIRCLLPSFSRLDGRIVKNVIHKHVTYNALFIRESDQIDSTQHKKYFKVLKSIKEAEEGVLNNILAIEGSHNLQRDHDHPEFIGPTLKLLKENTKYRFLYLTLTHLTRQPAAVHAHGTYIRKILTLTPNFKFTPDPRYKGISNIGIETIRVAYNEKPYLLLIDIKHMSYYSRKDFYEFRKKENYTHIPIVASHMGIAGCEFRNAKIEKIEKGKYDSDGRKECDRVFWVPQFNKYTFTRFNPWTINLFDEEIIYILESKGLIGLNLDQRILGVGKFPGEFMSPMEVEALNLDERPKFIDNTMNEGDEKFIGDDDPNILVSKDPFFQLTLEEEQEEKKYIRRWNKRHIDYLASNILHIIKVGFNAGYNGQEGRMHAANVVCLGSDFDGLTDPINFPKEKYGKKIDEYRFVTAADYEELRDELRQSIETSIRLDRDLHAWKQEIPSDLVERFFMTNGWTFLQDNFQ